MSRRRPGADHPDDPNQLRIEWSAKPSVPDDAGSIGAPGRMPELVQRLPWDFRESFPSPTPQALDAGIISEEDAEPASIKAIHQEHGRQLLATLRDLEFIQEARRQGFDPKTGKRPTSPAGLQRLQKLFATEPDRIERWWTTLIDTYAESFGEEAADAFGKAIRARHAGIDVVVERQSVAPTAHAGAEPAANPLPAVETQPAATASAKTPAPRRAPHPRTIAARFPVPRPLQDAIKKGHFGFDESGAAIRPSSAEVRAITLDHSEYLIDLMESVAQSIRAGNSVEADRLNAKFRDGIAAYAEDFGKDAGQQLEAFVRRQAHLREIDAPHSGCHR